MNKVLVVLGIIILAIAFSIAAYGLGITTAQTSLAKEVYYGIIIGIIGTIVLIIGLGKD